MNEMIVVNSIKSSFMGLGKDISHLSDDEIRKKAEITVKRTKELNVDVNNREEYLKVVYEVYGI
ncbi:MULTISPECIES: hypothetical protein [Bacillus cereus group]|uniref:hypothetical protein n=1 Tax=Bacillus cereus group TaxID=86661 RepID=UPI0021D6862E|nr:hypothetical protein [Bacillus thuringiensis]MCU7667531.1 hypothetical protein [Bacillus thuringiensis]